MVAGKSTIAWFNVSPLTTVNSLGSSRFKWKLVPENFDLTFFIDSKLSCYFQYWSPISIYSCLVQMWIFSILVSANVRMWKWDPNNTWSGRIFNSIVYVFCDTLCTILVSPSVTSILVVKSYFAAVANDTSEYKPLSLLHRQGFCFSFVSWDHQTCPQL